MENDTNEKPSVKRSGFDERMLMDGEAHLNGGEHESSDLIAQLGGANNYFVEDYGKIDTADGSVCPYIS